MFWSVWFFSFSDAIPLFVAFTSSEILFMGFSESNVVWQLLCGNFLMVKSLGKTFLCSSRIFLYRSSVFESNDFSSSFDAKGLDEVSISSFFSVFFFWENFRIKNNLRLSTKLLFSEFICSSIDIFWSELVLIVVLCWVILFCFFKLLVLQSSLSNFLLIRSESKMLCVTSNCLLQKIFNYYKN